jgi:putative ABC transport system ATP-binding protein/lipoprotein-releasing system ATP-binding protein
MASLLEMRNPAAAAAGVALVEAHNLSRTFGGGAGRVNALVSATCSVAPADRIAVVGASGSGKSTLLHLLAGLDVPTAGSISWPALGPRDTLRPAHVAVVFQAPSLLAPLSVVENVELPLLLGGANASIARAAAHAALERLELRDLSEKLPQELSGGQAQRVALARALAHQPRLILADEPTGQLDQRTAQLVLDELLAALDDSSSALVVATHDLAVAGRMHSLWRMRHGTLEVDG